MWPFKKTYNRVKGRNSLGQFTAGDGTDDGSTTNIKRGTKDIQAVAQAYQEIAKMQEAQSRAEQQRIKTINEQAMALLDQMQTAEPEDSEIGQLIKLAPMLIPLFQGLQQPHTNPISSPYQDQADLQPNGGASVNPAPAPPPQTVDQAGEVNKVLGMIAAAPEKMISKKLVTDICKQRGIDQKLLKKAMQKLSGKV